MTLFIPRKCFFCVASRFSKYLLFFSVGVAGLPAFQVFAQQDRWAAQRSSSRKVRVVGWWRHPQLGGSGTSTSTHLLVLSWLLGYWSISKFLYFCSEYLNVFQIFEGVLKTSWLSRQDKDNSRVAPLYLPCPPLSLDVTTCTP